MNPRPHVFFALALLLLPPAAAQAAGADEVGDLGAPSALLFEGEFTFTRAQIRDALDHDLDVQVAAAPTAPLAGYLAVLRKRLTEGYRHGGFPDAAVDVSADRGRGAIVVKVTEGRRYRAGAVKVSGGKAFPKDKLVAILSRARTPDPFTGTLNPDDSITIVVKNQPESTPVTLWTAGETAPFDAVAASGRFNTVRRVLCELGYFRARFKTDIVPGAGGKADLVIRIDDEGPRAVLGRPELVGLTEHTPEAVLEYLGLAEGEPVDLAALQAAQRKLWESARFKKHVLSARPAPDDPGRMLVKIEFEEYEPAPALGEPFTPEEQAALKLRQWLLNLSAGRGEDDLWLEMSDTSEGPANSAGFRVTLDPRRGTAGRASVTQFWSAGTAAAAGEPLTQDFGFALTDKLVGLYLPDSGQKIVAAGGGRWVVETSVIFGTDVEPDGTAKWVASVSGGARSPRGGETPGTVRVNFVLAPVAFMNVVHAPENGAAVKDGVLEVTAKGLRIRSDAETGRLLEFSYEGLGTELGDFLRGGAGKGALTEQLAALEKSAPAPNAYDPDRPAGSVLNFAARAFFRGPYSTMLNPKSTAEQRARAAAAIDKLLPPETFAPLETALASANDPADPAAPDSGEDFDIPLDPRGLRPQGPAALFAMLALPYVNDVFPRGSWPWTLSREMLMVLAGKPSESAAETSRIFASPDTGPIGYLACARILSYADADMAATFARRGLRRLTADDFAKDARALAGGDSPAAQVLQNLAANLRKLDESDVDAIAAVLPPSAAPGFRALAKSLRDRPGEPLDEALRHLWDDSLKHAVESELSRLAGDRPS